MKLFKISQNKNNGWDTYDSAVVSCETELEAKNWEMNYGWTTPENVEVEYLGEAKEGIKGLICASFNAG